MSKIHDNNKALKVTRQVRIADVVHFDSSAHALLHDATTNSPSHNAALELCDRIYAGFGESMTQAQGDALDNLRKVGFEIIDY